MVTSALGFGADTADEARDGVSLLEVDRLRVSFKTQRGLLPVLDDISFALQRGETLGIVGESGSGKSMLSLSVTRLLPRSAHIVSGAINWSGRDLVKLREKQLNEIRGGQIGMVFQDPVSSLNPTRRIGVQITEVLSKHAHLSRSDALRRATELLDEVRIRDPVRCLKAFPHELSGGMCQRVMIAIAIACAPKLIIADEPTTALDATIQSEVLALLEALRAQHGMAMIIISHDVKVVARVADRVAVMYAGEFVEEARTTDLFTNPQHPYTQALLGAAPRHDDTDARQRRLRTIPGSPPRLEEWSEACRFAPRCSEVVNDSCLSEHPELREVALGHWVRSNHSDA
jgi:oligopeptide/dipeptide ABC transporter ATP-binding protein